VCGVGERPIVLDGTECPQCRFVRPFCNYTCTEGQMCAFQYDPDIHLPVVGVQPVCVKKTCVDVKAIHLEDSDRLKLIVGLNPYGKYSFLESLIWRSCDCHLGSLCNKLVQNILNMEINDNISTIFVRICIPDVDLSKVFSSQKRDILQDSSVGAGIFINSAITNSLSGGGLSINTTVNVTDETPSPPLTPTAPGTPTATGTPTAPGTPTATGTPTAPTAHPPNMSARVSVGSVMLMVLMVIWIVI